MINHEELVFNNCSEDNYYSFETSEIPTCILNSVRRTIMSKLPKYSFSDNIEIIRNTSLTNNDIIKHRLSIVPIYCNEKIDFEINIENVEDIMIPVKTSNLICFDKTKKYYINPDITITKLRPKEKLYIKITTNEDVPDTNIRYRMTNNIIIKKINCIKYDGEEKKEIMEYIEDNFDFSQRHDKSILGVMPMTRTNLNLTEIIDREFGETVEVKPYIINNKEVKYVRIECDYYNPKEIFYNSIKILRENIMNTQNKLKLKKMYNNQYYYDLDNETATVGSVLTYFLDNHEDVEYSFFIKKFPTDKNIEIQIFLKNKEMDILRIINEIYEKIENYLKELETNFL